MPNVFDDRILQDPHFLFSGSPAADDPIVAAGLRWWGNSGHSVGESPTATPLDRNFRISTTALNNVLGVPYGEPREQSGMVGLVHRVSEAQAGSLWVLIFWGRGELPTDGIADLKLDGELASDLDWVVSVEHFLGSAGQAASTQLTTALASLGYVEAYPGYAYSVLRIDRSNANVPSSATFTAVISGRKILDYRTGTMVSSANPALILYDLLTHTEDWLAIPTSRFDTGVGSTWRTAADHCDTAMADGTKRYSFSALLKDRDPLRAIEMVRQHGFLDLHFVRSQYVLASRECSVSWPRAVEIGAGDWQRPPRFRRVPKRKVPNHVEVKYTRPDTWQGASVPVEDPAGVSAAEMRRTEITLAGCISRSAAYRWGVKYYNLLALERWTWQGTVIEAAVADVVPGQVVTMSTPGGVVSQPVRVESMTDAGNGWVQVELSEYDDGTDSTAVAVEDDPIVTDGGWTGGAPSPPSSCTLELVEVGPWEVQSLVTDPDELTAGNGWAADDDPSPTVAYDAGNDWTELTPTVGSGGAEANDWRTQIASGDGLASTVAYLLVALQIGVDSGTDDTAWIDLEYRTSADGSSWTTRFTRRITPDRGAVLRAVVYQIPVTAADYQDVGLVLSAGVNRWKVRRFHVVTRAQRPSQNLYSYDLVERWAWVEAGDAEDTTLAYQARKLYPSGLPALPLAEAPQGETSLEYSILPGASTLAGRQGGGMGGSLISTAFVWMFVLGLGGAVTPFPSPTVTPVDDVVPSIPTARTVRSQYLGAWSARDLISPGQYGQVRTLYGWTEDNCNLTYSGGAAAIEHAIMQAGASSPATITSPEFEFALTPPTYMVLTFQIAMNAAPPPAASWYSGPTVTVEYWAGVTSADTLVWSRDVTILESSGSYYLVAALVPTDVDATYHAFVVRVEDDTAGDFVLALRDFFAVPMGALAGSQIMMHVTITEAGDAATTVDEYRLIGVNRLGLASTIATWDQGITTADVPMLVSTTPHAGQQVGFMLRFLIGAANAQMEVTAGFNSTSGVDILADTFMSDDRLAIGDHSLADWDDSARAAGSLAVVGSDGLTKEYQSRDTLGLRVLAGSGSPEGAVTAPVGWLYLDSAGGAGTVLYIKESGSGNTGWVAK